MAAVVASAILAGLGREANDMAGGWIEGDGRALDFGWEGSVHYRHALPRQHATKEEATTAYG
jgi:hypothetical protein